MNSLLSSWKRYRERWVLGICIAIAIIFSVAMIFASSFLANVGFLVIGALVAMVGVLVSDVLRRPSQARDLARALYVELADRVARCCYDYETTFKGIKEASAVDGAAWNSFRLRKFAPIAPIIYPAAASQLAILKDDAPQTMVHFYYRLAALQRDVENIAASREGHTMGVGSDQLKLIAQRLQQALVSGSMALEALGKSVDGHEHIEAAAIAGYDQGSDIVSDPPVLRTRINKALQVSVPQRT